MVYHLFIVEMIYEINQQDMTSYSKLHIPKMSITWIILIIAVKSLDLSDLPPTPNAPSILG